VVINACRVARKKRTAIIDAVTRWKQLRIDMTPMDSVEELNRRATFALQVAIKRFIFRAVTGRII
jgi:hypothetical protein